MYASVITEQVKLDQLDEAARAWQALFAAARPQGLQSAYYLQDRQSGEVIVVGLWATEAAAEGFETSGAFQHAVRQLEAYLERAPTRKVYELAAQVGE